MSHVFHVSAKATSRGTGTETDPFRAIQQAADIARAGDEIVIHEGTYRESVHPLHGGESDDCRIVYRGASGEPRPIITGSERVTTWSDEGDGVWRAVLDNAIFDGFNPYVETVSGDWMVYPDPRKEVRHLGEVYLNGLSFYEVADPDAVRHPVRRSTAPDPGTGTEVALLDPDRTLNVWCCSVDSEHTTIWANFHDADPNSELVEINVRETCFYPSRPFVDYITVRGLEFSQAACPYAPPTADQIGLIGPRWSRGWVIEDNVIHDAKCSAVSLGKEASTGDNDSALGHRKSGYQYQMEAVFKALHKGWQRGVVGSHVVRNNTIYDCGQNGVVGHMGCAFSLVEGNHIFRIGTKREFFGWEVAAIKMHAALDVVVRANSVHDSVLGMWLDWQAQGTRVTRNVFYHNTRDVMTEVTHGPITFDNNIFGSDFSLDDYAQGAAFVNNLFAGRIAHHQVLDRSTPYHFPHVTTPAGYAFVYGGDDRYFNNIFLGTGHDGADGREGSPAGGYGRAWCEGRPRSLDAYRKTVADIGLGDEELYRMIPQPVYLRSNTHLGGARPADDEDGAAVCANNGTLTFHEDGDDLTVHLSLPAAVAEVKAGTVSTEDLGQPRIVEERFENPDSTRMVIDTDILGIHRPTTSSRGPVADSTRGDMTLLLHYGVGE